MTIMKPAILLVCSFFIFSCASSKPSEMSLTNTSSLNDAGGIIPANFKHTDSVIKLAEKYNDLAIDIPPPSFTIDDTGTEQWIDYSKYGEFKNVGTINYKYVVTDMKGLRQASGTGIYPNNQSIHKETGYKEYVTAKKLEGDKWKFVNSDDYQADFYKWSVIAEDPGVKLFYTAQALDKAGNHLHAIKAYYAILVFFPKSMGFTEWNTTWDIAPAAITRINYLTQIHPEFGVKLEGAKITIEGKYDNDKNKKIFHVNPGKLVSATAKDFEKNFLDLNKIGVKEVTGKGKVKLIRYNNNNFQLTVDDKPFVVRGICYSPTQIGLTPDDGSTSVSNDWSWSDVNKNGIIDAPYEAWVDANRNGKQDKNEPKTGDFSLLQRMGINTIRLYHYPNFNKAVLKDGYETYGFMYMVGNALGMYGIDSGADWYKGTDYTDPKQRENMKNSIRKMVEEYKDEPYVLMWVLGNENNYGTVGVEGQTSGTSNQAQKHPDAYYAFANECALLIKSLDPKQRPVTICNGDVYLLDICAKNAPDIDIYGANAYRGEAGFGSLWQDVKDVYQKPVLITEFGASAYAKDWSTARIEEGQASYHAGNWNDIENNMAGSENGTGSALGGVVFEWVDEWWKAGAKYDPSVQVTEPQWFGPFLDGSCYEEWVGITSQGDGKDSPFKRCLRKAYFTYFHMWEKYRK